MVAVPYSSLKSTENLSAGNLFFFLNKINGFFNKYETADAKTNPLDSMAAILSNLYFSNIFIIWFIVSSKAFSFLINVD